MHKHCGFTLIELLVVILIISITMTFAAFSFGDFGEKRRIVTAAQHFANYVNVVKQQAILESNTLGIRINNTGYDVVRFKQPNTWVLMKQRIFRQQYFPKKVKIHLKLAGTAVSRGVNVPSIIATASGDMTPFELKIGTATQPNMASVKGKSDGTISVITHD
ncbi:MAG: type II secretion system minor pseudopilin GspH [Legionellaceae bacterium]|nr:type II secretion system minor pseudopilin GspH [Legionellaceae bacterium]